MSSSTESPSFWIGDHVNASAAVALAAQGSRVAALNLPAVVGTLGAVSRVLVIRHVHAADCAAQGTVREFTGVLDVRSPDGAHVVGSLSVALRYEPADRPSLKKPLPLVTGPILDFEVVLKETVKTSQRATPAPQLPSASLAPRTPSTSSVTLAAATASTPRTLATPAMEKGSSGDSVDTPRTDGHRAAKKVPKVVRTGWQR